MKIQRFHIPVLLPLALACLLLTACKSKEATSTDQYSNTIQAAQLNLLNEYGLNWCDPDLWPIARIPSNEEKAKQVDLFEKEDPILFRLVLDQLDITKFKRFTPVQVNDIYKVYREARAIKLTEEKSGFGFNYYASKPSNQRITGLVRFGGKIIVEDQKPGAPACPRCLSASTLISGPEGAISVKDLKIGQMVWTMDKAGKRIAQPVMELKKLPVPPTHKMLLLGLEDGRSLKVSPNHPDTRGKALADYSIGDELDGSPIVELEVVSYGGGFTYDLLPTGTTGVYWANDVLIGTTLLSPVTTSSAPVAPSR